MLLMFNLYSVIISLLKHYSVLHTVSGILTSRGFDIVEEVIQCSFFHTMIESQSHSLPGCLAVWGIQETFHCVLLVIKRRGEGWLYFNQ